MRALSNEKRQRAMYEEEVHKALTLQALFEPPSTSTASSLPSNALPAGQTKWNSTIKPWLYRVSAVLCG